MGGYGVVYRMPAIAPARDSLTSQTCCEQPQVSLGERGWQRTLFTSGDRIGDLGSDGQALGDVD